MIRIPGQKDFLKVFKCLFCPGDGVKFVGMKEECFLEHIRNQVGSAFLIDPSNFRVAGSIHNGTLQNKTQKRSRKRPPKWNLQIALYLWKKNYVDIREIDYFQFWLADACFRDQAEFNIFQGGKQTISSSFLLK